MSKSVDERVVSMQFDNKQFERNAQTSISTLEKLKQSLNLKDSSKSLQQVGEAAKKVDVSHLGNGIETVRLKFSALQVAGVTALANITNSAVNAGKKIVSALTIDPIKTGFSEYETKINAVQTILSNTASKGVTMSDVTRVLDELNTYADKTIYNFAEMTKNIGTFTAAGVGLEESASAIQGIANLAAASGSTSQQASTAMYQLSQALAAGSVKLMDWNSVVNAGMGGEKFQEALKATAREHGIAVDAMIEKSGSFRESLKDEWITAEVLNETLSKFTVEGAKAYAESMMNAGKWTKEQADALILEAQAMEDAATKVKTFTQLWDTLKEAAQSGWSQTWELIVGDFEEAKEFFSGLSDLIGGAIGKSADARNSVLKGAMSSNWEKLTEKINEAGVSTEEFNSNIKKVLEKHGHNVDDLIEKYGSLRKAFTSGAVSSDLLKEALEGINQSAIDLSDIKRELTKGDTGDDVKKAQKALKDLGYDLGKFGENADGLDGKFGKVTKAAVEAFQAANNLKVTGIVDDATLEALDKAHSKTIDLKGDYEGLIDAITKTGGREMILESVMNVVQSFLNILGAVKDAWKETFGAITAEGLLGVIEKIRNFTEQLKVNEEVARKVKNIFKGIFSIFKLVGTIAIKILKPIFKVLASLFGVVGGGALEAASSIGEAISKTVDWYLENSVLLKALDKLSDVLSFVIGKIREWWGAFKELPIVKRTVSNFGSAFSKTVSKLGTKLAEGKELFKAFIDRVRDMDGITLKNVGAAFKDFWQNVLKPLFGTGDAFGEIRGAFKTFFQDIYNALPDWAKTLVDTIGDVSSKIKERFSNAGSAFSDFIGRLKQMDGLSFKNIIDAIKDFWNNIVKPFFNFDGMVNGIKTGFQNFRDWIKQSAEDVGGFAGKIIGFIDKILEKVTNINPGSLAAMAIGGGFIFGVKKITDVFSAVTDLLANPFEGIKNMLTGIGDMFTGLGNMFNSFASRAKSEVLKNIAISIALLVGSIIALALVAKDDSVDIWGAVGVLGALAGGLLAFFVIITLVSKSANVVDTAGIAAVIISLGAALVLMAWCFKIIDSISNQGISNGITAIVSFGIIIVALMAVSKYADESALARVGSMTIKIGAALLLLAISLKIIGGIPSENLAKGVGILVGFGILVAILISLSNKGSRFSNRVGKMIASVAAGFLLLAFAIKIIGGTSYESLLKGIVVLTVFTALTAALIAISKFSGEHADKAGAMIMKIGIAFTLIALSMAIIGWLSVESLKKGIAVLAALTVMTVALIAVSKLGGEHADKAGDMIMKIGVAFLLLSVAMAIISLLDPDGLKNAVIAIAAISACFAGLIVASSVAKDAKSTIVGLSIAIAVLAIALAALAMIEPKNLFAATIALSMVMGVMALLITSLQYLKSGKKTFKRNIATLGALILVVAGLAFAIGMVAQLEPDRAVASALALSILLLALSGSMVLLNKFSKTKPGKLMGTVAILASITMLLAVVIGALARVADPMSAIGASVAIGILLATLSASMLMLNKFNKTKPGKLIATLAVMAGVVALLGVVIGLLASSVDPVSAIGSAVALSTLLLALSAAIVILGTVRKVSTKALVAIGVMTLVVAGLALILKYITNDLHPEQALGVAISLSTLILALSTACILLGVAGLFGAAAFVGIGALAALIVAMGALIVGLGALTSEFPALEEFLNKGIPVLEKIGYAIGSFFGNIVAGFSEALMGTLPALGENLSGFAIAAQPFVMLMKTVDEKTLAGIGVLTAAVLALTAADLISGITSFLMGGSSFSSLGMELSAFALAAMPFIRTANTIDPSAMAGVKTLAEAILYITAGNLLDTITSWINGDKDLASFGDQLAEFGYAITTFSSIVSGKIDNAAVTAAASAGKTMAEMQKTIPGTGGVVQFFTGEHDFSSFTNNLVPFGNAIVAFSAVVAGKIDEGAITAAANAGKIMAEMQETIPNSGGVAQFFTGEHDFSSFTNNLVPFGTAMVTFSSIVAGKIDEEAVTSAANAGKIMAEMQETIPEDGGIFQVFTGKHDFQKFTNQIVPFGNAMVAFSSIVSGRIDDGAVTSAANAGRALSDLQASIPESGGIFQVFTGKHDFTKFGTNIVQFGEAMVSFSDVVSEGVDTSAISTVVKAAVDSVEILTSIPETVNLSSFRTGLTDLGNAMISFSDTIDGKVNSTLINSVADTALTISRAANTMPDYVNLALLTNGLNTFGNGIVSLSDILTNSNIDMDAVMNAAKIGQELAEVVATLPSDVNLVPFVTSLADYGQALVDFSDIVSAEDAFDTEALKTAQTVSSTISSMMISVPAWIDISGFLNNLVPFANSLIEFSDTVDEDAIDTAAIENAATAAKYITDVTKELQAYQDISGFTSNVEPLAGAIVSFSDTVDDDAVDKSAIETATQAADLIVAITAKLQAYKDISGFTTNVEPLGNSLVSFSDIVDDGAVDLEAFNTAYSCANRLVWIMSSLTSYSNLRGSITNIEDLGVAMKTFSEDVSSMATSGLESKITEFTNAIQTFVNNFSGTIVTEVDKEKTKVAGAFGKMLSDAKSTINRYKSSFATAGKNCVLGFCEGITMNTWRAEAKARAMADAAYKAAKNKLQFNSPSKIFIPLGGSVPEGFALGIDRFGNVVERSIVDMTDSAYEGTRNAISRIVSVFDSDMDAQPTIRPVIDLSDVSSGVKTMNGMLALTPSIGVLSNVGSINTLMRRNQNGSNDDVVSAINDLGRRFGETNGNTYNINGISYEEGSAVSNAIETLVRAIKIEGRK